jgi:uncharacterized protein YijF (DUF1287 family)
MKSTEERLYEAERRLDKMDTLFERIDKHLDQVQPIIDDYKASRVLGQRLFKGLKILGIVFGIIVSGISIQKNMSSADENTPKLQKESQTLQN